MRSIPATVTLTLGLLALPILAGCRTQADYPACNKDEQCSPDESCVDQLCQACRTDADCEGELACVEFRCQAAGGRCKCEPGLLCVAGGCEPCSANEQCPSSVCSESGRCEARPCATDDACPVAQICDGGQCLYSPPERETVDAICGLGSVYFAFDSARLSPNNQQRLAQAAPCLIETLAGGGELLLEAHADGLGGGEYGATLSERRGASVREFLGSRGLPDTQMRVVGKGAEQARGTDEASRAKDRRVDLILGGQ